MTEDFNALIGKRVREARKKAGLSLGEVAKAIVPPLTLQQLGIYERGENRWPVVTLCEVARVINVPVNELIFVNK